MVLLLSQAMPDGRLKDGDSHGPGMGVLRAVSTGVGGLCCAAREDEQVARC